MEYEAFRVQANVQKELNIDPSSIYDAQDMIFDKDGNYRPKTEVIDNIQRRDAYRKQFENWRERLEREG